jgi:hypothetical protein
MGSEWILGKLAAGVECIQLAPDRDRWCALVNTVMTLRVPASLSYLILHHLATKLFVVIVSTRYSLMITFV